MLSVLMEDNVTVSLTASKIDEIKRQPISICGASEAENLPCGDRTTNERSLFVVKSPRVNGAALH